MFGGRRRLEPVFGTTGKRRYSDYIRYIFRRLEDENRPNNSFFVEKGAFSAYSKIKKKVVEQTRRDVSRPSAKALSAACL
jgi:hypothetical protein